MSNLVAAYSPLAELIQLHTIFAYSQYIALRADVFSLATGGLPAWPLTRAPSWSLSWASVFYPPCCLGHFSAPWPACFSQSSRTLARGLPGNRDIGVRPDHPLARALGGTPYRRRHGHEQSSKACRRPGAPAGGCNGSCVGVGAVDDQHRTHLRYHPQEEIVAVSLGINVAAFQRLPSSCRALWPALEAGSPRCELFDRTG